MQASDWAPEHSEALRDYLTQGMSFSEIAKAINARFGTNYTRNAALGRSRRLGLTAPTRREKAVNSAARTRSAGAREPGRPAQMPTSAPPAALAVPPPVPAEPVKLRCVGISPRLVALVELNKGECRYPYGGDRDGEPITFCGHPQQEGSSYCTPHFHLTRGPGTASERAVYPFLRLVAAA
jgi:GcrA cell cycle regulator